MRRGVKNEGRAPVRLSSAILHECGNKKVTGAHLRISRATRATPGLHAILTVRFDGIRPLGFGATQYFSQAPQIATSVLFLPAATRAYRPATARGERRTRVLPRCACTGSVPLLLRRRCHSRECATPASKFGFGATHAKVHFKNDLRMAKRATGARVGGEGERRRFLKTTVW